MAYDTLIDADALAGRLGDDNWRVFDCRFDLADVDRGARAYAEAHIPGAFYAHLDRDLSGPITPRTGRHPLPDAGQLRDWLGRHGVGPDTQVIAYDDTGGSMAVRVWWLLRWLGHGRVSVLDGGWQTWLGRGHVCETVRPGLPGGPPYPGEPRPSMVVESAAIADQLGARNPALRLMDARTAERFRGEQEPIDPVAGHIPGAINLPLQGNLEPDGRFKSPEALRRRYLEAFNGHPAEDVVAMCGSGVTAGHNLLAMAIAGLPDGRLYAGSWSEWIRDPQRPIATGNDAGG